MDLSGKVAVVTGAGGTLCGPIAIDLAKKGCKVALVSRSKEKLQVTADTIASLGGECLILTADVRDEKRMLEVRDEVRSKLGVCTILVNGAGGNQNPAITTFNEFRQSDLDSEHEGQSFFDLDMDIYKSVIDINIMGTVLASRIFARDMAELHSGVIVNFASMNTYRPLSRVGAYALSKAAIANFTQWLAGYLAPAGIRVNAIAPGFFLNNRSRGMLTNPDGTLTSRGAHINYNTPMHRFGEAEELLGCFNWLIDDEAASFVTGITVPVDGGFLSCAGL